jgi:uncharacterized membrane protein YjgN (DUF898 family)
MEFFYRANDALTMTQFYTTGTAQAIGVIVGLLVLGLIAWMVVRSWRSSNEL